jgi:hypothetical protein
LNIDPPDIIVRDLIEKNVVFEKGRGTSFQLGLSATVLSMIPFGIAGQTPKNDHHRYQIEKVEGQMFLPNRDYVRKSVLQPEVLRYLAGNGYRKSLYMIVGIKVGFNAEITHQRKNKFWSRVKCSFPAALTGIPVDFRAKLGFKVTNSRYEKKHIPSAFVFAYRLREVRYSKKDTVTRDIEFTKGADLHSLYGNNFRHLRGSFKEATYLGTGDEIDIDGIFGEDFEDDDFDEGSAKVT